MEINRRFLVKLHRPVEGKKGEYPADTWLPARDIDGFIFVSYPEKHQFMKVVDKKNIKDEKEIEDTSTR